MKGNVLSLSTFLTSITQTAIGRSDTIPQSHRQREEMVEDSGLAALLHMDAKKKELIK